MRMGIFTKRDVSQDEELTFNYNVDRYGWVLSFRSNGLPGLTGRAQAHGAGVSLRRAELRRLHRRQDPDRHWRHGRPLPRWSVFLHLLLSRAGLTLETPAALGITDEVEALGLRGTKKKKGKHLDDDFIVRHLSLSSSHLDACSSWTLENLDSHSLSRSR